MKIAQEYNFNNFNPIFKALYDDKKGEALHAFNIAMTGSGKTTLLRSVFLTAPSRDNRNRRIFHLHIKPDPETLSIYRSFNIPIFRDTKPVYDGYWRGLYSHIVYHPRNELLSNIPEKELTITLLKSIFQEKIVLMEDGLYDTSLLIVYIDEAQFLMTNKQLDPRLMKIASEGRKFKMNFFIFSQRMQFLNRGMLSQAICITGMLTVDQKYMRELLGEFAEYEPITEKYRFIMYTTEGKKEIKASSIKLIDLYNYFIDNYSVDKEKIRKTYLST